MKRALVTITNSPTGFGGVSAWIERITKSLPQYGWEVITFTHAIDSAHLADWQVKHPGINLRPLFGHFARLNDIEPALEKYLDTYCPDVVLPTCSYWMIPTIQRRKQRGEDVRTLGIAHADSGAYYDGLEFYRDCIEHVVGVSKTCVGTLARLGFPEDRITYLPYGVPQPATKIGDRASSVLRLAYVGRLIQKQKRIFDFIPLIDLLNRRKVNYELAFYGAGEDEELFKTKVAEIDHNDRVRFYGWIPAESIISDVWPNVDIFVQVSGYEGLSISMLEAMAFGVVPVVSQVASGIDEVIRQGETGFSFPISDLEQCVDYIEKLAVDRRLLSEMSLNAYDLVHRYYSIEEHSRRLAVLLDYCVSVPMLTSPGRYLGTSAHPLAQMIPGAFIVMARRLFRRGDPLNQGFVTFP